EQRRIAGLRGPRGCGHARHVDGVRGVLRVGGGSAARRRAGAEAARRLSTAVTAPAPALPGAAGPVPAASAAVAPPAHPARPGALRRAAARHPWAVDSLVALGVLLLGLPGIVHGQPQPASALLTAGLVVPLVWRRRAPVAVFAILAGVALV